MESLSQLAIIATSAVLEYRRIENKTMLITVVLAAKFITINVFLLHLMSFYNVREEIVKGLIWFSWQAKICKISTTTTMENRRLTSAVINSGDVIASQVP